MRSAVTKTRGLPSTRVVLAVETTGKRTRAISITLPHRAWTWAALLLLVVFLIGNIHLVTGAHAPIWDAESFFAGAFTLVADHARAGRLVLWNPWESGGTPQQAEPELGTSSPIAVFIGALTGGTEAGFRLYWLCFWFLGPLGVLLLARHLGAPPWGGLIVALGFMFCGFYTSHAEHTSSVYSFSFLPLFLWRFDVAVTSRRIRPAVEAGALWGLSSLGGYPELTILSGGFLFLWAVGRCSSRSESIMGDDSGRFGTVPDIRHAILTLGLLFAVGVAVLSPAYVPFFTEGHGYSDRVGVRSREEAISSNLMDIGALASFSSPYLTDLKLYDNPKLWPTSDGSMTDIYVGSLVTILALVAVAVRPRSRFRWWLAGLILLSLACAVGQKLPVRGWLYDFCPPTRYFRNPALFRAYAVLSGAVLAIMVTADLQQAIVSASTRIWKAFLVISICVTATAVAAYLNIITHVEHIGPRWEVATIHFCLVWFGAVALAFLSMKAASIRRILPVLLVLFAVADALFTARLSGPMVSSRKQARTKWTKLNAEHNASINLSPQGLHRDFRPPAWIGGTDNNENLPLKIATFANYVTMRNRFYSDFLVRPLLREMSTGDERIWFASDAIEVTPTDSFYRAFVNRSQILGSPVLLIHPPKEMPKIRLQGLQTPEDQVKIQAIANLSPAQRVHAENIRYLPNLLSFEVTCPQEGWLLVTDRWTAGWRAKVNGQSTEVFGGNFLFRAVPVRAGKNRVEFSYHPLGWPFLLILSWGTLAGVIILPKVRHRYLQLSRYHISRAPAVGLPRIGGSQSEAGTSVSSKSGRRG